MFDDDDIKELYYSEVNRNFTKDGIYFLMAQNEYNWIIKD